MAMLAAANMDPAANPHPERLDLQRKPNRHIAFGTGIHFCLGHQLARIEGRCALKSLLRRWPDLELAVDPSEIKWRKRPGLRAIDRLPVAAGAASTRSGGGVQHGWREFGSTACASCANDRCLRATIVAWLQQFLSI